MGDGRSDVEGWGAYLRRMTKRPGWSVARLAREAQIHRATIFKYINGEKTGVTVATVTAIAKALGDDPANALRAAGTVAPDVEPVDEELELVRDDPGLTPEMKVRIVNLIMERRERSRAAELEETRRVIDLFKRGA
jgi:transcriptional regulator with XRE-family HTH domain